MSPSKPNAAAGARHKPNVPPNFRGTERRLTTSGSGVSLGVGRFLKELLELKTFDSNEWLFLESLSSSSYHR
jgi:hypothetical protein